MSIIYPIQLKPESAKFRTTNFPQYVNNIGTNFPTSGLSFPATPDTECFWKFRIQGYGSGSLFYDIDWYADTATSGTVVFEAQIAAITPNTDTQDVETKAFATLNFIQDTHLGTVGQRLHRCTIEQTNLDSLANGDWAVLRLARDTNDTNATDNMAGGGIVTLVTISFSDT